MLEKAMGELSSKVIARKSAYRVFNIFIVFFLGVSDLWFTVVRMRVQWKHSGLLEWGAFVVGFIDIKMFHDKWVKSDFQISAREPNMGRG
jgi:hypothetical protein